MKKTDTDNDLLISPDLILPIDAVTQKMAFLGRTGSGKSYASTKLCELMLEAKAQVVALDPVGVWWGLRTGGHFSIPVFGGLHGDIPIEPEDGEVIAELIVERGISAVLDVSQMLPGEQAHFAYNFATSFFQRKKAKPSPVHLFIEECQEFVPQNLSGRGKGGFEPMMLGSFERLIKLGRNFGIGASLISQRPQEVNKKALNQTELLFAFQMTGPQERKAIESWVGTKGGELDIVEVLPSLKIGEPHVWSPQWLGVSKTVKISRKRTDDVSSTPKVGARQAVRTALAPVDLEELRKSLAKTIEEATANDPEELRREIKRLEKENGRLLQANKQLGEKEASGINRSDVELIETLCTKLDRFYIPKIDKIRDESERSNKALVQAVGNIREMLRGANAKAVLHNLHIPAKAASVKAAPLPTISKSSIGVSGGLRRMMIALAQRPGLSAKQLGVRAGLSSKSGTFSTYLGKLRSSGWLDGSRDRMVLTAAGIGELGQYTPLPEGRELLAHWLAELGMGSGAGRMLQALAEAYPNAMTKEQLGSSAQISHGSGTFSTYLGKLRTLELIEGKGELRASADFFS